MAYRSYRWDGDGGLKSRTESVYDNDSKLLSQVSDGSTTRQTLMANGTLEKTEQRSGDSVTTSYYGYEWWDEAKQSTITAQPYNPNRPGWQKGTSHLVYDVNGHLKEARDEVGQRSLRYTNNAQGLVLKREEIDKGTTYKLQEYYFLDGRQVGAVGNDGPSRVDYAKALSQGALGNRKDNYRNGASVTSADFDQNYEPIGPNYPAQVPGVVTVRAGDTLQSLAMALWGDKAMWYLLADANGLSGNEALVAGQVLKVPNKVTNVHNSASTFRVYSPGEAIGDTSPTLPDPPPPPMPSGGSGCGGFGMILVAVVAVVAAIFTAGAALTLMAPAAATAATAATAASGLGAIMTAGMAVFEGAVASWAGIAAAAIGGAVGSMASQGVGMAMGLQDKFSWNQVGLSAFSSAASVGLAGTGGVLSGNSVSQAAMRTMAVNAATQGVAMAAGMQKSFNWTSVAASGVAVWATSSSGLQASNKTNALERIGYSTLRGVVGGTIQSTLGEDHRPNWSILAASSFGSSLGNEFIESQRQRAVLSVPKFDNKEGGYAPSQLERAGLPKGARFITDPFYLDGNRLHAEAPTQLDGVTVNERGIPYDKTKPLVYSNGDGVPIKTVNNTVYYADGVKEYGEDSKYVFSKKDNHDLILDDPHWGRVKQRIDYLNDKDSQFIGWLTNSTNVITSAESDELSLLQNIDRGNQIERWRRIEDPMPLLTNMTGGPLAVAGYFVGGEKGAQLGAIGDGLSVGLAMRSGGVAGPQRGRAAVEMLQERSLSVEARNPYGIRYNVANRGAPVRPTWRQSEIDVGAQLEGQGYKPQISFKDGVEVPYGTKGSVRPEYYREGSSVEVKNYSVETAAGRARLERNVVGQAIQRADNLPSGTAQSLTIDVRGQNVTRAQLNQMLTNIERKSGGAITRDNINILH